MVTPKVCPVCGSKNCEESNKLISIYLQAYYPGKKRMICWLCYDCGASETITK